MTPFKGLLLGLAVLVSYVAVGSAVGVNEANAAYSTYCGTGTKFWNSGGYAYKAVFRYEGTPSGGQTPRMYDIYKASQMSGWWRIAKEEQHSC